MHSENTFYFVHMHKAKHDAELEIENPVYHATLDRSKGTRLGLKLDVQVANRCLFIKEVAGGLAKIHNSRSPDAKILPGDRIVAVNGIEDDAHAMLEESKKQVSLEFELNRGMAIPIVTGLGVIVKQAFGNLEIGQKGNVSKVDDEGDAQMQLRGVGKQWIPKQDYDKFIFEDCDRYYLKRFSDFKELYASLKAKLADSLQSTPIKNLPNFPTEENFGFRRQLSNLGMSSFMDQRREGLQKLLADLLSQVGRLEEEPLLAEFFGAKPVPNVGTMKEDILKQKMEQLVLKHQALALAKAEDESQLGG